MREVYVMRVLSAFGFIGFDTEIKMGLETSTKSFVVDILNEFDFISFIDNIKKYDLIILRESFCCTDYDIERICNEIAGKSAVIVLDKPTDNLTNKIAALNKMGFNDILTENITVTKIIDTINSMNLIRGKENEEGKKENFKRPKATLKTKKEPDLHNNEVSIRTVTEITKNKDTEKKAVKNTVGKLERKLKYFNPNDTPNSKTEVPTLNTRENVDDLKKKNKEISKSVSDIANNTQSIEKTIDEPVKSIQHGLSRKPEVSSGGTSNPEKNDNTKMKERVKLYMCAHDMQSQIALNMAVLTSKLNEVIYIELDERNKALIEKIKGSVYFQIIELYGQAIEESFKYFKNMNARTSLIINGKFEADKLFLSSLIDVYVEVTQNQYVVDRVKAGFDKYIKPNLLKSIVVAYFEDGLMSMKRINGSLRQKSLKIYNTRQDEYNSRAESKMYIEWHSENIKEMIESIS